MYGMPTKKKKKKLLFIICFNEIVSRSVLIKVKVTPYPEVFINSKGVVVNLILSIRYIYKY